MTLDFPQIILGLLVHRSPNTCPFLFAQFSFSDENCATSCFTFFCNFAITFDSDTLKKPTVLHLHNKQVCFYKEFQFLHDFNAKKWKVWNFLCQSRLQLFLLDSFEFFMLLGIYNFANRMDLCYISCFTGFLLYMKPVGCLYFSYQAPLFSITIS